MFGSVLSFAPGMGSKDASRVWSQNGQTRERKREREREETFKRRASKLKAPVAFFSLTPRTGPGRQPSLVSSKGVGPPIAGRQRGVKPKKKKTLCLQDLQAEEGKVENL